MSYAPRTRTALSHEFLLECRERFSRVLMMSSLPSSSAVSLQMEPKRVVWFGKLSTEWWERPPLANMGKYGKKQLMDCTNNVGFECRMR
jgi:hypothetical protein